MSAGLRRLTLLFLFASAVRFAIYLFYTPPLVGDAHEYYYNSQTLENTTAHFSYEHWYKRTPVYMGYLHLTQQSIPIQIILSGATCVLVEMLYPYAGWVFALYPPSVMYANVYMKETLLTLLFVLAAYILRKRRLWLLVVLPVIFAGFISYGGVWEYNTAMGEGQRSLIHRLYILWRPDWHFYILVPTPPPWLETLLRGGFILVYLPMMFLFLRRVKLSDMEFWLVAGFSLVAIFSFGNERFREPVMPFIIGYVTPIAAELLQKGRRVWQQAATARARAIPEEGGDPS